MKLEEMTVKENSDAKPPNEFTAYDGTQNRIVKIVMPLGGSQSALFRYPKPEEKVLVGVEESEASVKYYLLGYMPDTTNDNIYTTTPEENYWSKDKDKNTGKPVENYLWSKNWPKDNNKNNIVLPDEMAGQFFRYKGPNDAKEDTKDYSEIGFYNERSLWNKDGTVNATDNPFIDTMKIRSAGDIHEKARNHHQIKAKRFELLVDCKGSRKTDKGSGEEFAFGDQDGDDPELYAGDAHIRAKNRIIIKAEEQIELKVGRSSILITDMGISIVSKKSRTNITTGWDTSITVDPKFGLFMNGKKIYSRGYTGFELSDMYGASISSKIGIIRITGMDIRLATLGTRNYMIRGILATADLGINTALLVSGIVKVNPLGSLSSQSKNINTGLRVGGEFIAGALGGSDGLNLFDIKDKAATFLSVFDTIQLITMVVGIILEKTFPEKMIRETRVRDIFYLCLAVVEYGIALPVIYAVTAAAPEGLIFESVLHLDSQGDINLVADNMTRFAVKHYKGNAPFSALYEKSYLKNIKNKFVDLWKSMTKVLGEAGTVALAAGGVVVSAVGLGTAGYFFGEAGKENAKFEEELRSL